MYVLIMIPNKVVSKDTFFNYGLVGQLVLGLACLGLIGKNNGL